MERRGCRCIRARGRARGVDEHAVAEGTTEAASGPPVVAVLPLDSGSGANEASLGVGVASALITDLASRAG